MNNCYYCGKPAATHISGYGLNIDICVECLFCKQYAKDYDDAMYKSLGYKHREYTEEKVKKPKQRSFI